MYSLLKGYVSRKPKELQDEDDLDARSEKQDHSVVEFRSNSSDPTSSTSSGGNGTGYLTWGWSAMSYVGGQLKKGITKTLYWDPTAGLPQLESVAMASKTKGKPKIPEGTSEYTVTNSDTLPKIALRFDTTPSELTRLNRLTSRMLFPGQVIFVPNKSALPEPQAILSSAPHDAPPLAPLSPSLVNGSQARANACKHGKVHLTKTVSLTDDEEEISEHFLKISAKYITDGQGVVSGVLLVTPHSVMFNPNVSDPLVLERGRDTYCITTPMSAITSAAMYKDIAAMAVHDPLKHGRFYLDSGTAESISRQNSIEGDKLSPPCSPPSTSHRSELGGIQEVTHSESPSKSKRVRQISETEPVPIAIDRGAGQTTGETESNSLSQDMDSESLGTKNDNSMKIIDGLLNEVITEVVNSEFSKTTNSDNTLPGRATSNRDPLCASPGSVDSGIICSKDIKRYILQDDDVESSVDSPLHKGKRLSEGTDHGMGTESVSDSASVVSSTSNVDDTSTVLSSGKSSVLAGFSGEVKYWLGFGSRSIDKEEIIPRPAAVSDVQPLYLCIRISKKHWCICLSGIKNKEKTEVLCDRDRRRREYWFAIPPSRVEHVYGFFKQWCPHIHNATSESEDEAEGAQDISDLNDDEVEPPFHEGIHTSEKSCTPDRLSDEVLFLPEMSHQSEIITEKQIKQLNKLLPSRTVGHTWMLVYSTFLHGFSLKTLYRNMECYDSPMLIIIRDDEHQIFGVLSSLPLRISDGFYGTGESFLFKFMEDGTIKDYKWTGENNFFMKGSRDSVAFGSGRGHFGLWLDEDFYHGSSNKCETYGNDTLSRHKDFLCSALEAWTFV
ncbi:oxidation resistance protein 1 isoform X2 [Nematostella vectensis]|uniref:oxidation resistance protein 1 isoform X2 n=1 Tax=Nematostella vectensis TaxID=45351 RepID=UPI002076FFBC|nr:oxidation resistance protein 1 isoform X2 [Nematostella vectensis]